MSDRDARFERDRQEATANFQKMQRDDEERKALEQQARGRAAAQQTYGPVISTPEPSHPTYSTRRGIIREVTRWQSLLIWAVLGYIVWGVLGISLIAKENIILTSMYVFLTLSITSPTFLRYLFISFITAIIGLIGFGLFSWWYVGSKQPARTATPVAKIVKQGAKAKRHLTRKKLPSSSTGFKDPKGRSAKNKRRRIGARPKSRTRPKTPGSASSR